MDLKLIRNIVRLMERSELTELNIDDEKAGLRIHLKRGGGGSSENPGGMLMMPPMMMPGVGGAPVPVLDGGAAEAGADPAVLPEGVIEITSPMVGTYYRAPSPGADNFIEVGAQIDDESVVCIIEAMKVMNEIKAECRGEVLEILVENGEPVEYGQPLFLVKKA